MIRPKLLTLVLLVILGATTAARADRVLLRNGRSLSGKVVEESTQEIVLELDGGMRMRLRKATIERIERTPDEPDPGSDPRTGADTGPRPGRDPDRGDGPGADAVPTSPPVGEFSPDRFFSEVPRTAWDHTFGRYPVIRGARLVRFRAYDYVKHSPLAAGTDDPRIRKAIREHGHGGTLSLWEFKYAGNLELRFGDEVKLVGEITAPKDDEDLLIRLDEGPITATDRLVVLLLRRDGSVRRYATTTVFDNRDLQVADIEHAETQALPVRTFTADYRPLGEYWVHPRAKDVLREMMSPFGDSARVKIARYRFRVEWYATPEGERPALDPGLLAKHVVRPLAREGGPVASAETVARLWGPEVVNRERLDALVAEVLDRLAKVGVKPGRDHYVEEDRIGVFGASGVTIETRRYVLDKAALEPFSRP